MIENPAFWLNASNPGVKRPRGAQDRGIGKSSKILNSVVCRLTLKIGNLVKTHINIKRELPVAKASRIFSGS
jgi:hypothetical protein